MKAWPYRPGVPAAGHVTSSGHWHPGAIQGCMKCESRLPPVFELHVPGLPRPIRSTLDRPERIKLAWHRQAHGVYELLTEDGRDKYRARPQENLWEVREYVRTVMNATAAYYEPIEGIVVTKDEYEAGV